MAKTRILKFMLAAALAAVGCAPVCAQSSDQLFPTPVTASEVTGIIKARDVGDSRLTAYFYTFSGDQGDMFVNVVSKNFNGDIDIFIAEGLKPLSKIVVYADTTESETGRVIYLRKPEKIILRIEGRTPNDDPATFKLKFAGSFVAATDTGDQTDRPEVKPEKNNSRIQVNSVGTIISVKPKVKPTPKPIQTVASKPVKEVEPEKKPEEAASQKSDEVVEAKKETATNDNSEEKKDTAATDKAVEEPKKDQGKMEVVVTDNIPETKSETLPVKKPVATRNRRRRVPPKKETAPAGSGSTAEAKTEELKTDSPKTDEAKSEEPKTEETKVGEAKSAVAKAPATRRSRNLSVPKPEQPKTPDPLENIHLVIVFKDGRTIERPMSDVVRFTVDRGILTVVSKDGSIGRYAIADVLKTTIE